MKRFVVIGLGRFGSWIARTLHREGFEVIALDTDEGLVDRFADEVSRCVAGDGTDVQVLREVGVAEADAAVISTGEDLAATILATLALKELGVATIWAKVSSTRAAQAIERFDITGTIFPEREAAERMARRVSSTTVLDYIQFGGHYSIQEMAIPDAWIGRSLRELALPRERGVQLVALYDVLTDHWQVAPDPDAPLKESDVAIIAGSDDVLHQLTREVERGRRAR
jgi:trk system potassium uptake protein TrkA